MKNSFYPSVTQILQATVPIERLEHLQKWKEKVGNEESNKIRTESMARGDNYDSMIRNFYENQVSIPHEPLSYALKDYKCHSLEKGVISEKHKYYGRYDILFEHNNCIILNDFKGSSKPKREEWIKDYILQISAYTMALIENKQKIDYSMIMIILPNDVQKFVFSIKEMNYYFELFLKRLTKYNQLKTKN
jgi:genome maintenance exonuclease 1